MGIPDLPHLILVPGTTQLQWIDELKIFFRPKAIEIYEYPIKTKDQIKFFDGPNSGWSKSAMPFRHRVIVVAHAVRRSSPSH
jgi:TATA-binding protein-associated factor